MRRLFLLLLPVFLISTLAAQVQYRTFPDDPTHLKHAVLDNGLEIYLLEDYHQSNVFGGVIVKAGGKYDPADATGMGHYLEHMLFKGTETLGTTNYAAEKVHLDRITELYEDLGQTTDPEERKEIQQAINQENIEATKYAIPNETDRLLTSIGSRGLNAFTAEEMIVYHNYFPAHQMEKWLDLYAQRFTNPVFRLFQSELETVYEEKNRAMDSFIFPLITAYNKHFYKNHPYGQQTILGETEHLKNPSLSKMYDYYNTYYVANNMALVLCGNFDALTTLPVIAEKFGSLPRGDVPDYPTYEEEAFKGRESIKVNYTPVAVGIGGFRAPAQGSPDEIPFEVASQILSNYSETGLLDRVNLDQEVLMSEFNYQSMLDYGTAQFIVVPKLLKQSLKKAEAIIMAEIQRIGAGEFEDWQLKSAKIQLQNQFKSNLENPYAKAMMAANAFISGQDWEDVLAYSQRVEAVSREQVVRIGQEYLGDNYFMLESKMGFPKKEKLDKPGYTAPEAPEDAESAYAARFKKMPEGKARVNFVDFHHDFQSISIGPNTLYHVSNPVNDIFQLSLRFQKGTSADPLLNQAALYMGLVGTDDLKVKDLKKEFSLLGAEYSIRSDAQTTRIQLNGLDAHFEATLQLLTDLIVNAQADEEPLSTLVSMKKTESKVEKKDVTLMGQALLDYVRWGKDNDYLRRLSSKEIKQLTAEELLAAFRGALATQAEIHYSGNTPAPTVQTQVQGFLEAVGAGQEHGFFVEPLPRSYDAPTVFFIPRKDAVQSQIYFYRSGIAYDPSQRARINAFNEYFGGGMSSLVFQEIREFRSLAYSTRAYLIKPKLSKGMLHFWGFVGCQGDKSAEAIAAMHDLVTEMPEKPERLSAIRQALVQQAGAARPGFRMLTSVVTDWKRSGYTQDPREDLMEAYPRLEWSDLTELYRATVIPQENAPLVIAVVGDPKRISEEELSQYGKVIPMKAADVLGK